MPKEMKKKSETSGNQISDEEKVKKKGSTENRIFSFNLDRFSFYLIFVFLFDFRSIKFRFIKFHFILLNFILLNFFLLNFINIITGNHNFIFVAHLM